MTAAVDQEERLMEAGRIAHEWFRAAMLRRVAKEALTRAYAAFKEQYVGKHIERGSEQWDLMMKLTKPQFERFEKAKAQEKNAKRRLERACRRCFE